jgi:drug/metabolite transporter (DMT)-like permease
MWFRALELGAHAGEAHKLPPLTYLVLVLSVLLGRLVLHESFGEGFWQGTALIAAGNAVCLWPGRRRRQGR